MSQVTTTPDQATWSDVDKARDTAAFAAYLDTVRSMEAANAYKQGSIDRMRLREGMSALDVGCGTGDDARKLADRVGPSGRVLGIDFSAAMVDESRRRWGDAGLPLEFQVGDAHRLELASASFDAVRADRMFQHLASPLDALRELVRVTRPGGRVVISDPDWGTYILDASPSDAVKRYQAFAQGQAKNPWIGRQLYGMFREVGLQEVEVSAAVAFFLDYGMLEKMGNLDAGFVAAVAAGQMTEPEVALVKQELQERQQQGRFFVTVNVYTVSGTVPA